MNSTKLLDTKPIPKKSVVFLYTGHEQSKKKIKEANPFITASKRIKYLGINLAEVWEFKTKTTKYH